MWHFDIPKCRDLDAGKVEVIARNQCGEAYATTTLEVTPRQDDYRSVLRHNVKRKSTCSNSFQHQLNSLNIHSGCLTSASIFFLFVIVESSTSCWGTKKQRNWVRILSQSRWVEVERFNVILYPRGHSYESSNLGGTLQEPSAKRNILDTKVSEF